MTELILASIVIFFARVADYSIATLRLLMTHQGRKGLAWLFGFVQALIFILAVSEVLTNLEHVLKLIGYAGGFATGNVVGLWLDSKLAMGFIQLQIVSSGRGDIIADELRKAGYGVTLMPGRGRDGTVNIVLCTIRRRELEKVEKLVSAIDVDSFVISERARSVIRGFWHPRKSLRG